MQNKDCKKGRFEKKERKKRWYSAIKKFTFNQPSLASSRLANDCVAADTNDDCLGMTEDNCYLVTA